VRLAVDANVLLSIALGGAAARLVTRPDFELFTTPHTLDETLEYLPILAARKGLRLERMERALHAVPYESSPRNSMHREEAQRRIGARDPDDIDLAMPATDRLDQ